MRWYGGGWSSYAEQVAGEQAAAEQAVRAAESDVRRQRNDLVTAQEVLARRKKQGARAAATQGLPKIVIGARKRAAQESAAKYRATHQDRLADARGRLDDAEAACVRDDAVRIDLPGTEVPPGRIVLDHRRAPAAHRPRSRPRPPRPGAGRRDRAERQRQDDPAAHARRTLPPAAGTADVRVPLRLLPQRLDVLDDDLSVAENVASRAPGADANAVRARLARFLFRRAPPPAGRRSHPGTGTGPAGRGPRWRRRPGARRATLSNDREVVVEHVEPLGEQRDRYVHVRPSPTRRDEPPAMVCSSVVLPEPFGPTSATRSGPRRSSSTAAPVRSTRPVGGQHDAARAAPRWPGRSTRIVAVLAQPRLRLVEPLARVARAAPRAPCGTPPPTPRRPLLARPARSWASAGPAARRAPCRLRWASTRSASTRSRLLAAQVRLGAAVTACSAASCSAATWSAYAE